MHPRVLGRLGAAAGLALMIVSSAQAEPRREPAPNSLAQCIAVEAEALGFSGVVSVVGPAGAVLYTHGALGGPGSRDIGAETRFNLGSATKMFTAVAVAQLIDAGEVGLDDPIGRYVTGLTPEASAVTVRQLLSHTSGLGNFFTLDNLAKIEKASTVSDLLPLVAMDKPAFQPGSRFQYSNTGFLLLGSLVERVSGVSYGDYLRLHVFAPAGMTASSLEPGSASAQAVGLTNMPIPGAGPGERSPSGPLRPAAEAALHGNPAGGSYSTAGDMQRFFAALMQARLTRAAMVEKFISPQIAAAPAKAGLPQLDHGLGFGVGVYAGHRWFGHNGGAPGANVEASAFPDDQTTVVVMANRDPPMATTMFQQVRAMLLEPVTMRTPEQCAAGDSVRP